MFFFFCCFEIAEVRNCFKRKIANWGIRQPITAQLFFFSQSEGNPKPIVTYFLRIFPRLAPVTCFPTVGAGYMFSRAWRQLHAFPRLAPVTCFPALGTGYMFSRAWHRLSCFPALWHWTHVLHSKYYWLIALIEFAVIGPR